MEIIEKRDEVDFIMTYLIRNTSVITGKKNLEHLYTFKHFPVFMACITDNNTKDDLFADMSFSIDPESGIIQLDKVLPLDLVYQHEHSDGVGKIWQDHYSAFVRFLTAFSPRKVLEIGGGNGIVASLYVRKNKGSTWTIVEPLPLFRQTREIKVVKQWFTKDFIYNDYIDTIIHSHVLEHMYNPRKFLDKIYDLLPIGGKHIFSSPNLYIWLKNKYTNTLNFEHTIFLTEYFIDYLLSDTGFTILKKEYYRDHSIFYAVQKTHKNLPNPLQSHYKEYKNIFSEFVAYHKELTEKLNKKIEHSPYDVYLFGAHVFSQSLLYFGLKENKIKAILDNSPIKHHKRLYGTSLIIYPPEVIETNKPAVVIVKAAEYQVEIVSQLRRLNKRVIILE